MLKVDFPFMVRYRTMNGRIMFDFVRNCHYSYRTAKGGDALRFFGSIEKGTFLSRPNRFVIACNLGGRIVKAFLPNPGRLKELLLPGATLYLEEVKDENRDLPFTAVAVEREGERVVLHTHRTNDVARYLIETGSCPRPGRV